MAKETRLHKADRMAMVPPNGKGLVRVAPASVERYEKRGFTRQGARKGRRAPATNPKE